MTRNGSEGLLTFELGECARPNRAAAAHGAALRDPW